MEKISILLVLCLPLFFHDIIVGGAICSSATYYDVSKKRCELCPACDPGEEHTRNCGHNETGAKTGHMCKKCRTGFFQDKKSTRGCPRCQSCSDDEVQIEPCTAISDTVCANECPKGKYEVDKVCRPIPPTTVPVTTPVTSPSTTATTKQVSSQKTEITLPSKSTTSAFFPPEPKSDNEPQASQKGSSERRFGKPGWLVFFSLMGSLLGTVLTFVTFRKRKQITALCRVPCRKYRELSSDHDVERGILSAPLTVEDHYAEPAEHETNKAEPFFPKDDAVSPAAQSPFPSTELRYPRFGQTKEIDEEKRQCACSINEQDLLMDEKGHYSSLEDLQSCQHGRQTPSGRSSSNPSTPGASSRKGATPVCGVSTENNAAGYSSSSSSPCFPSRAWSRDAVYNSSSSSINETSSPSGYLSPNHCCSLPRSASNSPRMTPQGQSTDHSCSCVTSSTFSPCATPQRGRSPNPPSISSSQVHSESSEEPEISNQSNDSFPMSIEACDEKHNTALRSVNSGPAKQNKGIKGNSSGWKKGSKPKKDLVCSCGQDVDFKEVPPLTRNHTEAVVDRGKDPRLVGYTDKSANSVTAAKIGKEVKDDEIAQESENAKSTVDECKYKKICRKHEVEHRCRDCCPQSSDLFFSLINNDRPCLKEPICTELNKNNDYRNLLIWTRMDAEMKETFEGSQNPAERVLDRLKARRPKLTLEEFQDMLAKIKRNDIAHIIHTHHFTCNLCRKNSFDSRS